MLSALKNYQKDIIRIMQSDIVSAFSELSETKIYLTQRNVSAALMRILQNKNYVRRIPPSAIPSGPAVSKEVQKQWSTINKGAREVFGNKSVTLSKNEITVTVWAGVPYGTGSRIQKNQFKSYNDVERVAFPIFKEYFETILVNLMTQKNFDKLEARGGTTQNPRGGMGRAGFNFAFSLSHTQSQKGLQAGYKLREDTDLRGRQASIEKQRALKSGDAKALAQAAGKSHFYNLASTEMGNVMPAVTLTSIKNSTKKVSINRANKSGGTSPVSMKIPGNFSVVLEFDEIKFQALLGASQGVDITPVKQQWQDWANNFADGLTDMWAASPSQIWFLEGSDSRDEGYANLITEQVIGEITKGNKSKLKLKRKTPPKRSNAKARTAKAKGGKKGSTRKTTHRRAKTTGGSGVQKRATPWRNRGGINPVGLRQLIQKSLPDTIARKMTGPPTLQYQTGRFANSATVTDIVPMPGSVEIRYEYQTDPYYVFEPESGNKLASRGRDPRALIGSSIREIAQLIMGSRFGLVRTKREL